jgi:hypothetical protein
VGSLKVSPHVDRKNRAEKIVNFPGRSSGRHTVRKFLVIAAVSLVSQIIDDLGEIKRQTHCLVLEVHISGQVGKNTGHFVGKMPVGIPAMTNVSVSELEKALRIG